MENSSLDRAMLRVRAVFRIWRRRRPGRPVLRSYPTASDRQRLEELYRERGWGEVGKK